MSHGLALVKRRDRAGPAFNVALQNRGSEPEGR
jgi:hypothetical protein